MKRINSLSDLLMEELADLLDAVNQLAEALPDMANASQSPAVKATLAQYLELTNKHAKQLKDIFNNIGQYPQKLTCKAMKGLVTESKDEEIKNDKGSESDAAFVNLAQRMLQYEITRYKTVREHAADLGHSRIVELFTKTLNDQRAMNFHLNELAQGMINVQAGGFYIPEGKFTRKSTKKKDKGGEISRYISEGNPNIQDQKDKS